MIGVPGCTLAASASGGARPGSSARAYGWVPSRIAGMFPCPALLFLRPRWRHLRHGVHLQDLVAVVVDDLDGDLALRRRLEWDALRRVQLRPLGFVDLGAQ